MSRRPGGGRPAATTVGVTGTTLLVVAVLAVVWPVLAVVAMAGVGAAVLARGGLRWAARAAGRTGRADRRHRITLAALSAAAFSAALVLLMAPATAAWVVGVLLALVLAATCSVLLWTAVRGGRERLLLGLGSAVGLAVGVVAVVVPPAAIWLAVLTVVGVLTTAGGALLLGSRSLHRDTVPG